MAPRQERRRRRQSKVRGEGAKRRGGERVIFILYFNLIALKVAAEVELVVERTEAEVTVIVMIGEQK